VGNNGETLVADSSTSTGLRYQAPVNVNPVLNSAFQVWQRGTAFTNVSTGAYMADRWWVRRETGTGGLFSRQATGDTTNLPNIQYCARLGRPSGDTTTGFFYMYNSFESINSIPYAGKTVTFSFYARKGANYSATSSLLDSALISGTGTDQNIAVGGYTGQAAVVTSNVTLTTTWQRFTLTGTVPTTCTELSVVFGAANTSGTAGAADYFEVTGVQLEVGSVATPFKTNGATIQGELAACQRYYFRSTPNTNFGNYGLGIAGSTTNAFVSLKLPTTMRVIPTSIDVPSTITALKLTNIAATNWTISAIGLSDSTTDNLLLSITASGMTANQGLILGNNNNTAGFIGASAEL
jgi:hypothetical protein